MKHKHYLAITIGPLIKTLSEARSTRELWSASYTFSYLMRCLVEAFNAQGAILLSPALASKVPLHGAGIYPDRCFFGLPKGQFSELEIESIKDDAIAAFSKATNIVPNGYYQIYHVQLDAATSPIKKLNEYLDTIELQTKYHPKPVLDLGKEYWNHGNDKSKGKKTFQFFENLYHLGYGGVSKQTVLKKLRKKDKSGKLELIARFPSIPEIATKELELLDKDRYWKEALEEQVIEVGSAKDEDNPLYFSGLKNRSKEEITDERFMEEMKDHFKEEFKNRHKYFAIVQADGDGIGALIQEVENNNGDITAFSNALNEFVQLAAEEIVQFGAFPVYLGGDDMLFYSPISNGKKSNAFLNDTANTANQLCFLLTHLRTLFIQTIKNWESQILANGGTFPKLSMSYGVAIAYHKHPMRETYATSLEQLFGVAKKKSSLLSGGEYKKDYIALHLQKHSGQPFQFGFQQESEAYKTFLEMSKESYESEFLNSVMFQLENQKKLIPLIACSKEKLTEFFSQNFNKRIHEQYGDFFQNVVQFICTTYKSKVHKDKEMQSIFGALRFIQFLNQKDHA